MLGAATFKLSVRSLRYNLNVAGDGCVLFHLNASSLLG